MLIASVAAVALPTVFRAVTERGGSDLCPYIPFMIIAAIMLDWHAAAAVALGSSFLAAYVFDGARLPVMAMPCASAGIIYFAIGSVLTIAFAQAFRKAIADPLWLHVPNASRRGLVFSQREGQACVSWYGGRSFVPLGPADEVEEMMRDFLAQQDVGRRLVRQTETRVQEPGVQPQGWLRDSPQS
jgi:hypothetical protein